MRVINQAMRNFAEESGESLTTVADYTNSVFTGYVTALLWSESCNGTMRECDHLGLVGEETHDCDRRLDEEYNECDLTGAASDAIWQDVTDFVTSNWSDLYDRINPDQAGHDFLLTRNGHGAGFWDRGLGELGDRLTAACKPYGTMSAYGDEMGTVGVEG